MSDRSCVHACVCACACVCVSLFESEINVDISSDVQLFERKHEAAIFLLLNSYIHANTLFVADLFHFTAAINAIELNIFSDESTSLTSCH